MRKSSLNKTTNLHETCGSQFQGPPVLYTHIMRMPQSFNLHTFPGLDFFFKKEDLIYTGFSNQCKPQFKREKKLF